MSNFGLRKKRVILTLSLSLLSPLASANEKTDQEEVERCQSVQGQQVAHSSITCEEVVALGKPRKKEKVIVSEEKTK